MQCRLRPHVATVDGYRTWEETTRYILFKKYPDYTSFIFTFREHWQEKYPDYERADLADIEFWDKKYTFTVRGLPLEVELLKTEDPELFRNERYYDLKTELEIVDMISFLLMNNRYCPEEPKDDPEAQERYRYLKAIMDESEWM